MEDHPEEKTTPPVAPTEVVSEDKVVSKQALKAAILHELVRRKQEMKMDTLLEQLMEKHAEFKKGISHNKFGCACLGANMIEKAE
jgi:hypothetical protein